MVNATGHSSAKYLKQVANGEIDVLTSLLYLRKGKEFLESEALKKISKKGTELPISKKKKKRK